MFANYEDEWEREMQQTAGSAIYQFTKCCKELK